MIKIWKYTADQPGINHVTMPENARIISVQPVGNTVTLWAEVNPAARWVNRRIQRVLTGESPSGGAWHLGTCVFDGGAFVVHVYDLGEWPLDPAARP